MWLAILVGVGLALGVLLLANFVATRATLRPPRTPFFITPRDLGLPYQNVAFPSRDGIRLHGWWLPAPKPRNPRIHDGTRVEGVNGVVVLAP